MRVLAKKNAGCPKAPRDFPPEKMAFSTHLGLSWDPPPLPPPESVRAGARTLIVTTKFSRIDRLPNLLSNSAPPARSSHGLLYKELYV